MTTERYTRNVGQVGTRTPFLYRVTFPSVSVLELGQPESQMAPSIFFLAKSCTATGHGRPRVRLADHPSMGIVNSKFLDLPGSLGASRCPADRLRMRSLNMRSLRSTNLIHASRYGLGRAALAGSEKLEGSHTERPGIHANPQQVWLVKSSRVVVNGADISPLGPLPERARLNEFLVPQRGIFAIARAFLEKTDNIVLASRTRQHAPAPCER
jgi:hypothetical protein